MKQIFLAIAVLLFLGGMAKAQVAAPTIEKEIYSTSLTPKQLAILNLVPFPAQVTNPCGTATHCTILTWDASSSQASCLSTGTPPCAWTYNVLKGISSGGEATAPINTSAITALTYIDPITLTSAPQTYFYEVEAQETVTEANGTVVAQSSPSNEASASFPGQPSSPASNSAVAH